VHYRARVGLETAVRVKLQAQADFVDWWDHAADKNPGARAGKRTPLRVGKGVSTAGKNGLPDSVTIHRWRKLTDPATFAEKFDAVSTAIAIEQRPATRAPTRRPGRGATRDRPHDRRQRKDDPQR